MTLLLFSLCTVSVFILSSAFGNLPLPHAEGTRYNSLDDTVSAEMVTYTLQIAPLGYAVFGLVLVMPLFWVVEHCHPDAEFQVEIILAQGLAITTAGAIWGSMRHSTFYLVEGTACCFVFAMLVCAIWRLAHRDRQT
ncbi:hypothetical protein OS189_01160 [Sulfitobacter sp. F26169L]|uniref:hypothetical protein n=1 Tax=Sulfitobacter sp. F26169L TaxID=2996015 RepID=UPI002260EE96|nr:hypothetical protein [Sulfitobacter sp. F26169L]MCX7564950.1 hypothetical protein [Sulfitobacter sp. F26169L]